MIIQGSREQLAEKTAYVLYKAIQVVLKKQDQVVVGVPGGRSIADILQHFRDFSLPWKRIQMFMLDERLVPLDHPDSNYKLVKWHMGSKIPEDMIHPFIYDPENPDLSLQNYSGELKRYGGHFDVVLASSGEDGHIASLFPNHHSVEKSKSGFFLMYDSPKPPPGRMSASFELIRQADSGIILFWGSEKKNALRNFFNIHLSHMECPAKIMTKLSQYYLLTDQEVETP
jgi:6-phosphogluconolactonase